MISVEMLLDPATEAAVLTDWEALITADLPSAGRHPGESNRPHVTVAAREAPRSLELPASVLPLPVTLGGLLLFPGAPGRVVLARSVVATADLIALHAAVAEVVGPVDDPRYANTEPGAWTPHVTLARRMPVASLPAALDAVSREPIVGKAVELRIWDSVAKTITPMGDARQG